jgi:hypothetical protein
VSRSRDTRRPSPSFGGLVDPLAAFDDVVGGEPDFLVVEVESVLPQAEQLAATGAGGEGCPQVEAELFVLGPDEVEEPGGLPWCRRVRLAAADIGHGDVLGDVAVDPLVSLGER